MRALHMFFWTQTRQCRRSRLYFNDDDKIISTAKIASIQRDEHSVKADSLVANTKLHAAVPACINISDRLMRLRQFLEAMENASLPSDVWNDVTPSVGLTRLYLATIRDLALKVIYIVIGTVGVLDNLFVIIVFALFVKITDKVRRQHS